jgi:hypothetical protein
MGTEVRRHLADGWLVLKDQEGECGPRVPCVVDIVGEGMTVKLRIPEIDLPCERDTGFLRAVYLDHDDVEQWSLAIGVNVLREGDGFRLEAR